jgi:hypothetical protein
VLLRIHDSSQGRVHTLPQTAGKGFACLITSTASSNFLFFIRLIYALTFIPAGHDLEHSGSPITSIL